eukprot:gene23882-28977_t
MIGHTLFDDNHAHLERGAAFLAGGDNYRGPEHNEQRIADDFAVTETMRQREYGNVNEHAGQGMSTQIDAARYGTSMAMDNAYVEEYVRYESGMMGKGYASTGLGKSKVDYVSNAYVDPRAMQYSKDTGARWVHGGGLSQNSGRQTSSSVEKLDKYNSHGPAWNISLDECRHVGRSIGGAREVEGMSKLKPRWYAGMPDSPKYYPSFTNSGGTGRDEEEPPS